MRPAAIVIGGDEARRPEESGISEGNLAENPLFVLTNREARPLDERGEIRLEDYERVIELGFERIDGQLCRRAVVVNASPKYGFPTMFAYRVLLAVIQKGQQAGFQGPRIEISRREIAASLGYKTPGGDTYADIENACFAMTAMTIEFNHAWYDRKDGHHRGRRGGSHLVAEFDFRDERGSASTGGAGGSSHVTLGEMLFEACAVATVTASIRNM